MHFHLTCLSDASGAEAAGLSGHVIGGRFDGRIDLAPAPAELRRLFEQFEEIVEGQMLSLLDGVEGRIAALNLSAVRAGGRAELVHDPQVYPSTGAVSFTTPQQAPPR